MTAQKLITRKWPKTASLENETIFKLTYLQHFYLISVVEVSNSKAMNKYLEFLIQ